MIHEEFDIELRTKIDGVFIIGQDRLNEAVIATDEQLANDQEYEWQDIKEGILSISVKRGVDTYTGALPLPFPSAGVMTIRTTNRQFDPNYNKFMEPKAKIRLKRNSDVIFQGRVNNIYVDYRSDKDKPVIRLDVMDPTADLQQASTKLSSISAHNGQSWVNRINTLFTNSSVKNFPKTVVGGGTTKHGYWKDNKTLWEAIEYASNTEGAFVYFDKENTLKCYASSSIPTGVLRMNFDNTDNTKYGYKNIAIDYNVESTINEVAVQNTYGKYKSEWNEDADAGLGAFETVESVETDPLEPKTKDAMINRYGTHALNIDTNFDLTDGQDQYLTWATSILEKWYKPVALVKEIEWDAKKDFNKAAATDILDRVNIKHETQNFTYNEQLQIIGIHHDLQADGDSWRVKFILFPRSRFI